MNWPAQVAGYGFAVVVGDLLLRPLGRRMWLCLQGSDPTDRDFRPDAWQPGVVGIVERILYIASLQMGQAGFIGVWLALKVAGQWKRWGEEKVTSTGTLHGRSVYQNFLIGNGLSVMFAAVGFLLTNAIAEKRWDVAVVAPAGLVALTIALWVLVGYKGRSTAG